MLRERTEKDYLRELPMAPNRQPRVSVVMPTYNQAKYIREAIDSVLNQTFQDFELIIVNDGSTDSTPQILEEYQRQYAQNPQCYSLLVINKKNEKLPRALNTGFEQACGEYLTWTSSDNNMKPDMLEKLVSALDRNPHVGFAYGDWDVIDDDGNFVGTVNSVEHDRYLLMRFNYINACFMYRHEVQDTVGLYDPEYIYAEDWEYWWRIAQSFEMMRVPEVLYEYRIHGTSLTSTAVTTQKKGKSAGYVKLLEQFRANKLDWYISKVKLEVLRRRLGHEPLSYATVKG
jgi:glycosyltransferase involved in cell wall biosynthesis